jgi:hypothetical protein
MTLMPEFRQQLLEAAANRSHGRGRRHSGVGMPRFGLTRLRPRLGAPIATTASILVVGAVLAVVLTIGRAHRSVGTPGGQRDGGVPGVATARAQLLGELSALRHGYASKLTAHLPLPPSVSPLQIDRSLVRTVQTRGYKVTLIPVSHTVRRSASSRRTTGLVVTVQGPNVHSGFPAIDNRSFAIGNPVSPAAIARHGTIIIMYVSGPLNRAVVVVPDGVTRVQLSRFVPDRSSGGRLAAIAPASASVHDNIAVIPLPDVTTTALHQTQQTVRGDGGLFSRHRCRVNAVLYFVPVSARMTWWRKTDTGSEARATTVRMSLNGYSTTLLPPGPCRRSRNR